MAYPHVEWLYLDGERKIATECAILKRDVIGNTYFVRIKNLDKIDKVRLVNILQDRNVDSFELWDLMHQTTLQNGVNALTYFHQLAECLGPQGTVMKPRPGVTGTQAPFRDIEVVAAATKATETKKSSSKKSAE